jgi:hypothetical protein
MNKVILTLTNGTSDYSLTFALLDISIAQRWLKHLGLFIQAGQPWDDSKRFYNFPNDQYPESVVVERLKQLVGIIKTHDASIIQREFGTTLDQDDLNYLHHVFEVYHGLYDQQHENEFFMNSPKAVQDALGDLNIWIHRYETLGGIPRFVATWKYKPYRDLFTDEDFKHFSLCEEWGDLRLNYCEIGKTLYDFWHDNDQYISAEAFQPHHHYCFDFTVRFAEFDKTHYDQQEQQIWHYFDQHTQLFSSLGYSKHDPRLAMGGITIGKLQTTDSRADVIDQISRHQCLKSISVVGNG